MQKLNLPNFSFNIKSNEKHTLIFDNLRKKYVVLTPEEWVRQHYVHYLIQHKNCPISLIAVEKQLIINNRKKRTDIVVFDKEGTPNMIVECKAPHVPISQATFDQIARYNLKLKAKYLILTNGIQHYYCQMDFKNENYIFLKDIPDYHQSN